MFLCAVEKCPVCNALPFYAFFHNLVFLALFAILATFLTVYSSIGYLLGQVIHLICFCMIETLHFFHAHVILTLFAILAIYLMCSCTIEKRPFGNALHFFHNLVFSTLFANLATFLAVLGNIGYLPDVFLRD